MVVSIIFIGVRVEIGGFVGDVIFSINFLVIVCDYLIINFNVVIVLDIYFV